jgi:hypothetical protein
MSEEPCGAELGAELTWDLNDTTSGNQAIWLKCQNQPHEGRPIHNWIGRVQGQIVAVSWGIPDDIAESKEKEQKTRYIISST